MIRELQVQPGEELVGYRWWHTRHRLIGGWQLRSVYQDVWWKGPQLATIVPPSLANHSGIRAVKTWEFALEDPAFESERRQYSVLGEVALWGKVVEHERGYRAGHAKVRRLVVPARLVVPSSLAPRVPGLSDDDIRDWVHTPGPGMAKALARRYRVDVEIGPPVVWPATA